MGYVRSCGTVSVFFCFKLNAGINIVGEDEHEGQLSSVNARRM